MIKYKYGDFQQLAKLINYWTRENEGRDGLRARYHNYVKANHTYNNRMEEVLKIVSANK